MGEAAAYLAQKAQGLERAGADFIACGSNTMHRVSPAIEAAVSVPFLHIVDVVAQAARRAGVGALGLLGTLPVMEAGFYQDRLASHGLSIVAPAEDDRAFVDRVIFDELTFNVFTDDSRREYVRVMHDLRDRGAEAIVLGCTEITQLVGPNDFPSLPLLDSTALHVEAIVNVSLTEK
ncbi:aspartate/glutamate racemase family protein [Salana multivorans]|uniref:aspartate/glutamate racemase family protein n=1 Tax=Salana multivorans TaxID=120377 RepID=UPI001B88214F|nr:amino acid racemase [Salana multivorans]